MQWIDNPVQPIDSDWHHRARIHQQQLTKPPGSLGRLEDVAVSFCAWQKTLQPTMDDVLVAIFAGDHGICSQRVSAFPQAVTMQMVTNFLDGGAAVSVLSESLSAQFTVCNTGMVTTVPVAYENHPRLFNQPIANGTQDFSVAAAMTMQQLQQALDLGRAVVKNIHENNLHRPLQLFIGGEMGIGNTSSASAIFSALLKMSASEVVGRGTGVDDAGLQRKVSVIETALALHGDIFADPFEVLRCLGGFEIAALVGSYLYCAQQGIPIVVDGFICTSAALIAMRLHPEAKQWMIFSHCSQESAHQSILHALDVEPMLNLGLRLGEGSGAALVVPLLRSALLLHNRMATFQQAGVSDGGTVKHHSENRAK